MNLTDSVEQRCLIVGPSWVGDMIMAQSLFMVLKQQQPSLCIDVLAPAWSAPLLQRMPQISELIDMPLGHGQLQLGQRYHVGKSLRSRHYQQAILLPNSFKSALIPFWAEIPKRSGYVGELRYGLLNDIRTLDQSLLTMTVQRFVALAYAREQMYQPEHSALDNIPYPALHIDNETVQATLAQFQLACSAPVLALCPGAEYGPAKQWPAEHYAQLARAKMAQGWQVWLFGSQKDQAIAQRINQLLDEAAVNLCARTELAQAIDLMSVAQAVVSNDSGLMHMAAALGVPVVGIYGSSDPTFTPPLGAQTAIASLHLECSPCFKRFCPQEHTRCLQALLPEQVSDALERLLAQDSPM